MAVRWANRPNLQAQYDRLSAEPCPALLPRELPHDLRCGVPRRTLGEWLKRKPKRVFWDCDWCDLHEERVSG